MAEQERTSEQEEFLKSCEEEFEFRFSNKDEDFMKMKNSEKLSCPPVVDPWSSKPRNPNGAQRQYHVQPGMIEAVLNEDLLQLEFLIQSGVDVNIENSEKRTPLHYAVQRKSNKKMVEFLLKHGAKINSIEASLGSTPLHNAVKVKNNIEIVNILIKNGANVNAQNHSGETPLHEVIKSENCIELVKNLIEHDADVNAKDKGDHTPLHKAIYSSLENNIEIVKILVEKGADVNSQSINGDTPLHVAICKNKQTDLEIVKLLLENGADANTSDGVYLPIHEAVCRTNDTIEILNSLLEYGADINGKKLGNGETSIHYLVYEKDKIEILKLFIDRGADINLTDSGDFSPLFKSMQRERGEATKILLNNGAELDDNVIETFKMLYDYYRENNSPILNIFFNHFIKLKIVDLLDDNIFSAWESELTKNPDFEKECTLEVEKMGEKLNCEDRNISFLNILKDPLRKVAVYINVEDIQEKINAIYLDEHSPHYSGLLKRRVREAKDLAEVLDNGHNSLKLFLGDDRLPYIFSHETLNYLSIEDINNLISSFKD